MKSNAFGERKTLDEALEYVFQLAQGCGQRNSMTVHTAVRVVMNTIANELLALEKKDA